MGYGAAAGVIAEMRRQNRREEARREARRALARAGRAELRRRSRAAAHGPSTRAAYPCAFACADCLTMQWPTPPSNGHPLRTEPVEVGAPSEPCRECGETNWVDSRGAPSTPRCCSLHTTGFDRKRRRRARRRVGVAGGVLGGVFAAWMVHEPPGIVLAAALAVSLTWVGGGGRSAVGGRCVDPRER